MSFKIGNQPAADSSLNQGAASASFLIAKSDLFVDGDSYNKDLSRVMQPKFQKWLASPKQSNEMSKYMISNGINSYDRPKIEKLLYIAAYAKNTSNYIMKDIAEDHLSALKNYQQQYTKIQKRTVNVSYNPSSRSASAEKLTEKARIGYQLNAARQSAVEWTSNFLPGNSNSNFRTTNI